MTWWLLLLTSPLCVAPETHSVCEGLRRRSPQNFLKKILLAFETFVHSSSKHQKNKNQKQSYTEVYSWISSTLQGYKKRQKLSINLQDKGKTFGKVKEKWRQISAAAQCFSFFLLPLITVCSLWKGPDPPGVGTATLKYEAGVDETWRRASLRPFSGLLSCCVTL